MSDWNDLKDLFSLSDTSTDELLDIVNWVTSLWLQDAFGYPKDTPQSFTIRERFLDEKFQIRFDKAISESELELSRKNLFGVK